MGTKIDGSRQIQEGSITRDLLDTTTPGKAVVTKIVAGPGISITSTGVDPGTGEVTLSVNVLPGTVLGMNIDGGRANEIYSPYSIIDGGRANEVYAPSQTLNTGGGANG